MPQLAAPTTRVHASFLAAMDEYMAEGRGSDGDMSMLGRDIRVHAGQWTDPGQYMAYLRWLRADALEESPRPDGHVPATTLWWVEADEYLGRLSIRHRLTPSLLNLGGHIGYDIRPSARRRGHATTMWPPHFPSPVTCTSTRP